MHLVVFDRAGPGSQVLAVEDRLEARASLLGQDLVGFVGGDLAHRDVSPLELVVVGLKLDRAAGRDRQRALPVVFEDRVVDDELVVQVDRGASADLDDPECVPLADRIVGANEGIFAGCARAVVPEAAGALVGAHRRISRLGEIPDLHLRGAAQVNAAIPLRTDLPVDAAARCRRSLCRW